MSPHPSTGDLRAGMALPALVVTPTTLQLFRFSAATWNSHRIHYDQDYAAHEGYPGLLVQSHLHAAIAVRSVTEAIGPGWRVSEVSYRIRRPSTAGRALRFEATVAAAAAAGGATFDLDERDDADERCLEGSVTVERSP